MPACEHTLTTKNHILKQTIESGSLTGSTSPDTLPGHRVPVGIDETWPGIVVHQRTYHAASDVTAGLLCQAPALTTLIQLFFTPMRRIHALLSARSVPSISKARFR